MTSLPVLYSFRRCPYAIRARLAIAISAIPVIVHEVNLNAKPERMLQLSPKGTVPVLELLDGRVIDESLDIMRWAFEQNDPLNMLLNFSTEARALIERNDTEFKYALDRYKYPERHPEFSRQHYRALGEICLFDLNKRLDNNKYFFGNDARIADLALMPFIRQFASVDHKWFDASPYPALRAWLDQWMTSDVFIQVMQKPSF